MNIETLQMVSDKKFTDFETAVKAELKNKLANHPDVQSYTSDFDKIQQMKTLFSKINQDFGEEPGTEEE